MGEVLLLFREASLKHVSMLMGPIPGEEKPGDDGQLQE